MLLKNGDEIHLLVEDSEAGIAFTEEIGMIFVVLHDMSKAAKEIGRTHDNGVREKEDSLQKKVEEKEQSENKEIQEIAAVQAEKDEPVFDDEIAKSESQDSDSSDLSYS